VKSPDGNMMGKMGMGWRGVAIGPIFIRREVQVDT